MTQNVSAESIRFEPIYLSALNILSNFAAISFNENEIDNVGDNEVLSYKDETKRFPNNPNILRFLIEDLKDNFSLFLKLNNYMGILQNKISNQKFIGSHDVTRKVIMK